MAKVQKWYVVWAGRKPGVYGSWAECEAQVKGYPAAKHMAFESRAEAEAAYSGLPDDYIGQHVSKLTPELLEQLGDSQGDSYAVDAAASGSPGPVEYRCVHLPTGREVFRRGPFEDGTNNVGEFLAIVHALALFKQNEIGSPIYSDSETALIWVRGKRCRTNLEKTERNEELFNLIERAEAWLQGNDYANKVAKWETDQWGENPADFGRK
jgi:ribonuclease HI